MKSKLCPHCKKLIFMVDFCSHCGTFVYDPHDRDLDENETADWWKRGEDFKPREQDF